MKCKTIIMAVLVALVHIGELWANKVVSVGQASASKISAQSALTPLVVMGQAGIIQMAILPSLIPFGKVLQVHLEPSFEGIDNTLTLNLRSRKMGIIARVRETPSFLSEYGMEFERVVREGQAFLKPFGNYRAPDFDRYSRGRALALVRVTGAEKEQVIVVDSSDSLTNEAALAPWQQKLVRQDSILSVYERVGGENLLRAASEWAKKLDAQ